MIDYLWGEPAQRAMIARPSAGRPDRSQPSCWTGCRSAPIAGPTIELPSVALRSANLRMQGNGQGAVSTAGYLAELPSLVVEIDAGTIRVRTRTAPLSEVETVWTEPEAPGVRTVLLP